MHLSEPAITAALLVAIAALWMRRHTWSMPWETAATANVALQGAYTLLAGPTVSRYISPPLHRLTGLWNLEELVGIFCYLAGLTTLLYMLVCRLDWAPEELERFVRQRIELPATLFVPATVGAFIVGGVGRENIPDLELVRLSSNMGVAAYWFLVHAGIVWLLAHTIWALLIIRRDDTRSAGVVYAYLTAVGITCICVSLFILDPIDHAPVLRFFAIRAELAAYAIAASYSWSRKKRHLQVKLWRQIRQGRARCPRTECLCRQEPGATHPREATPQG